MGLTNVKSVIAEPVDMMGPEVGEEMVAAAEAEATEAAAAF
ncbi:MAG TPA: hypothetical protein QGH10_05015 [Armatimonadota bacterium]|nr:hypothetical protein [Armatimonadota bacterium]